MTFLDYYCEKKYQMEAKTSEWLDYEKEAQKHWKENLNEIKKFFGHNNLVFISFSDLEFTPFKDIPKFLTIFPTVGSLECYFTAVSLEYLFVKPEASFVSSNLDSEKSGYTILNPFLA